MVMSSLTFPGDLFAEVDELQRQIERVFAPRYPSSSIRAVGRGAFPAVNIGTTPDAIEVYAFAPGLDPSSLEVTVDRGLLTIAGNRAKSVEPGKNGNVYAQERPSGSFRRTVSLPDDADPAKVEATYRHGVLKVRVDKREASKPRRIEITDAR